MLHFGVPGQALEQRQTAGILQKSGRSWVRMMEILACERNYKWANYVFLKQNFICTDFEKENLGTRGEVEHNLVLDHCF